MNNILKYIHIYFLSFIAFAYSEDLGDRIISYINDDAALFKESNGDLEYLKSVSYGVYEILAGASIKELNEVNIDNIFISVDKVEGVKGLILSDSILRAYMTVIVEKIVNFDSNKDYNYSFSDKIKKASLFKRSLLKICKDREIDIVNHDVNDMYLGIMKFYGFKSHEDYMLNRKLEATYERILLEDDVPMLIFTLASTEKFKTINIPLLESFIKKKGKLNDVSIQKWDDVVQLLSEDFIRTLVFKPFNIESVSFIDLAIFQSDFREILNDPLLRLVW